MSRFMERVRSLLVAGADGPSAAVAPRAPDPIPLRTVMEEIAAKTEASIDRVKEERMRREAECSPNGVFTMFAIASLDARIGQLPARIALNRFGWFDGALGLVRSGGGTWRLAGDARHLDEAMSFALPNRPAELAKHVLQGSGTEPTDIGVEVLAGKLATPSEVDDAVGAVARRLPRHVLVAAMADPRRALDGLGIPVPGRDGERLGRLVDAIVSLGIAVDEVPSEGMPVALAKAASEGRADVVAALVARGASVTPDTSAADFVFEAAAMAGSPDVVRALAKAGYPFDAVNEHGETVLHAYLDARSRDWQRTDSHGDACTVAHLVEAGVDFDREDRDGRSAASILREDGQRSDNRHGAFAAEVLALLGRSPEDEPDGPRP